MDRGLQGNAVLLVGATFYSTEHLLIGIVRDWRWSPASNDPVETTMLPSLPPEILDSIVDHLYGQPSELKACCLVSKSWVPRARRNLFAQIEFTSGQYPIRSWMNAFPDPSSSPGHHTRSLHLFDLNTIIAASLVAPTWVRHFCHVEKLHVANIALDDPTPVSLVQLYGLSPTLKYLILFNVSAPISEVLNLICSFPLLEELRFNHVTTWSDVDGRDIPSTSPGPTRSLHLIDQNGSVTRELSKLPNDLHFARIAVLGYVENAKSLTDLILGCSDALESLSVAYYSPSVLSFAPLTERYLTASRLFRCATLRPCSWSIPDYHHL